MQVTLKNGRRLKVQFVHSSHDFVTHEAIAGGLRQFVDNLARSLSRRVTLCDIADVTDGPVVDTKQYTSLAQGFAVCYYKDNYVKLAGRSLALARAVSNLYAANALTEEEGTEFFDLFPTELNWLMANVETLDR